MDIKATFVADFREFETKLEEASKHVRTFEYQTKNLQQSLQTMTRSFDGSRVQTQARMMAEAIDKVGGATRLTDTEQRRALAALNEARAKYQALGKEAPASVTRLARELERLTTETRKAAAASENLFKGTRIKDEAAGIAAAIRDMGSVSKLTAAEQRQANQVITEAIAKYRALGQEAPADLQKVQRELQRVAKEGQSSFGALKSVITSTFGQLLGAFSAQAIFSDFISGIKQAAKEAVDFGGKITDMSAATGLSTTALQEYAYAAEQTGGSLEGVSTAVFRLSKNLGGGGKEIERALGDLRLSLADIRTLSPEQQFQTIATALGQVQDQAQFARDGVALFGKGFQSIAPMIKQGFQGLAAEARRLGLILSNDVIAKMDELGDQQKRLQIEIRARAAEHAESIYRVKTAYDRLKIGGIEALSWLVQQWQAATAAIERQEVRLMQRTLRSQISGLEGSGQAGSPAVAARIAGLRAQLEELERLEKQIGAAVRRTDIDLPLEAGQRRDANLPAPTGGLPDPGELSEYARLLKNLNKQLSGVEVIQQAKAWHQVVKQIGGITQLTADEQAEYNRVLDEALRKYRALGQEAPAAWKKAYDATRQNTQALQQWAGQQRPGAYLKTNPFEGMFTQADLQTWVESQVAQLTPVAIPLKLNPFEGMDLDWQPPKQTNWFVKAFAGQNIGQQLTQTIIGAFQGGGDVGRSIGGALGGLVGNAGGAAMSAAVKGLGGLAPKLMGMLGGVLGPVGSLLGGLVGNLFGKLFGSEAKETKKMRNAWLEQAGGLAEVRKMAEYAGVSIDKLLSTKKTKVFEQEVKKLEAAFKATQARVQALIADLQTFASKGQLATKDLVSRIQQDINKPEVQAGFQAFVQTNMDAAAKGLTTFLKAAEQLPMTQRAAGALGDAIAGLFGRMRQLGASMPEALEALGPAIDALATRLDAAGMGGGEAFDQLRQYAALAANEVTGPLLSGIDGLSQALTGLANSGLLTQDMFAGLSEQIGGAYQQILAGGADANTAIRAIAPSLQRLWEIQQQWGFAVDETTQGLIAQAQEQGLVGQQMQDVNKQILDVLKEIAKALGATIPDAAKTAGRAFERELGGLDVPTIKVPYEFVQEGAGLPTGIGGEGAEGFATGSGGLRNFGTGTPAILHGQEAVLTKAQYQALLQRDTGGQAAPQTIQVVLDGQVLTQVVARKLPGVIRAYGVA